MSSRINEFSWSRTSLGPVDTWSQSLLTMVRLILAMPQPATILWGPDAVQIYNDAYVGIARHRHPALLGMPVAHGWPDAYDTVIAPILHAAREGRSTHLAGFEVTLDGPDGRAEVRCFDTDWSPIHDEGGAVAGVLQTLVEVTERRRAEAALRAGEERQAFLLNLSDALRPLAEPADIQSAAMKALAEQMTVMRAAYLDVAEDGDTMTMAARFEIDAAPTPARLRLSDYDPDIADAFRARQTQFVRDTEVEAPSDTHRAAYRAIGLRAWIMTPIVKHGRLIAVVGVQSAVPRDWSEAEVRLIDEVAERTWAAVERGRAETALRESEAQLAAAFESVPVGVAVIDGTGRTVAANAEYRRFLPTGIIPSRDPARVDRWRAWDAAGQRIDPSNFPGARALRGETVVPGLEMLYRDDDGREIWTSVATAPTRDADGHVTGIVSTIADIDQTKRGGDRLRESEERLRQFGEASQDILWLRDAETLQWEYLTPAFEAIYGLSRTEAMEGDDFRNWVDLILPEDRTRALDAIGRVRGGDRVTFDYRVRRPVDGAIRWLRNTDFPILDREGRVTLVGGVGHDLTELHDTELRLQTLMEGIPQLVWRAVDGGRWTWASPQWTAFTGQPEAASHDWGWLDALHPEDRDAARQAWEHAATRGVLDVEYRLCDADDACRWFQTRATPVRDEGGAIVEWLGTSTDIQELRALQGRQQVMVQELQHRTRNLITVVGALSNQTMKNARSLDDFGQRFGLRLQALSRVQGLLSHLSAGRRIAFDDLLRSELNGLGAPDDQITLDGPSDVPLRSGTVQTFSLALHELATNALKYGALAGPEGHLTVRWWLGEGSDGRPRLRVDWRESGMTLIHVDERGREGGYGRQLIERALPYQLSAETTYEITADGVHCTIDVPISMVPTKGGCAT